MGRRASVRYWESRGSYMCTWKGKQVVLAVGPKDEPTGDVFSAACRKFGELVTLGAADTARDENTVRVVMELYLRHVEATLSPATLAFRLKYVRPFVAALGDVRIRDLTRFQVSAWLDAMRQPRKSANGKRMGWGDMTRNAAIGVLLTGFRWAVGEGLITRNPLNGIRKPRARSRGRDALIGDTPEERNRNLATILDAATPAFRPFIKVLAGTGARPGEISHATADDFDAELGAIHYHPDETRRPTEYRHKNAGRGKERIIVLVGEALEIVRNLVVIHPTGPLFRTSQKRKGARTTSGWTGIEIIHRFAKIQKKTGLPVTAYSLRHQYATDWLKSGGSIDVLAELLGNTPAVLRQHYSHLLNDTANLRRQAEDFMTRQRNETPRASDGVA